jgi:lipopolysaccharide transport system permease protein
VRYKQAFFGIAWAVIRPLAMMLIFTFVFSRVASLPSDGVPYPLFVFAALLPWQLFSTSLSDSGQSLVGEANLVSKIYFPRMIVPAAAIMADVIDLGVGLAIILLMTFFYGISPGLNLLALPFFIFQTLLFCIGIGLLFAALNVKYRDFRYVAPFILQLGLYASPVGYGSNVVPPKWHLLFMLNPMVGIIDGFRYAFFGVISPLFPWSPLVSLFVTVIICLIGVSYFRATERTFADVI